MREDISRGNMSLGNCFALVYITQRAENFNLCVQSLYFLYGNWIIWILLPIEMTPVPTEI